jgi:integrase
MLIRKIDRRAAMTFLAELKPIHTNDNKKELSGWAKHRVLRHCKTLFKDVVKDGLLKKSPFGDIARPKCTPSDWYYLKPDELHKLLEVTPKLSEKVLYALAYTAGLRESEALALYWTNIDFDKGRVRIVNRPATEQYPPFDFKDSDVRTIPLPKLTLDMLAQLQLEAPDNVPFVLMGKQGCQRIRDKWQKYREQGRPWLNQYWSNNVIRNFHRRVKWAGIEPNGKELTVHVLRKCCGQNWANTLPMNVVKEFMGHSSIDTTERFYSTVDDDHFDKATETMNYLLKAIPKNAGAEKTDHKLTFSKESKENQRV